MRCPLALYRNRGGMPIDLRIGELPGEPPYIYAAEPGDAVEGPASYERQFVAAGYYVEKQLGIGELKAPQGWPGASPGPKIAVPVAAAAVEQAAPASGVIIGAPGAPSDADDTPAPRASKKRGG